jgi:hypothetical protein
MRPVQNLTELFWCGATGSIPFGSQRIAPWISLTQFAGRFGK